MPDDLQPLPMSWFDSLAASLIPYVPMPIMRRFSVRYIAGEQREDALRRGADLMAAGYGVIYDQLGEAVESEAEVEAAMQEYLHLLDDLEAQERDRNISLKPTQMGLNLSEDLCIRTVRTILDRAAACDAFTRFEMEESETVDGTLRVFDALRESHGGAVGIVLQSMLHRTEADAERLLDDDRPLNVRLVKGIYVEPPEIAYQDGAEINASFLRILRRLLDGGAFVGVATHDEKLVAGLQEILAERPEHAARCEIQMLMGVREELRQEIRAQGLPVRVYLPYGVAWHKYVVRRLKKNPKLARYAFLGMFRRQEKLS